MVKPVNWQGERALFVDYVPVAEPDATLSDDTLLDMPDDLVEKPGRAPAAQAPEVNCRTPAVCCESRQVSRRTRQALAELRRDTIPGRADDVGMIVDGQEWGGSILVNTDR